MSVDELIKKGADRLQEASRRLGDGNGLEGKLRDELAEDAAFLRRLKPSAIAARAHGETPQEDRPAAPAGPQLEPRRPKAPRAGGPNPILVIAAAFAIGYVAAKVIDWRGHAHPRS